MENMNTNIAQSVHSVKEWTSPQITEIEIAGGANPGLVEDLTYHS